MAQRKPYNPHTKYGRKKMRQQTAQRYASMTPKEKKEFRSTEWVITIIVFSVLALIFFLIGGVDGLLWLGGQ